MSVLLESFDFDSESKVYVHPDYHRAGFDYTDGAEVEGRIYKILKATKDLGVFSRDLCNSISDWPTEYHFSPVRHNLLRHYCFSENDRVLELGCGCGAITRQLGEAGARITAIEGSLLRAQCAKERCRDLDNVKVYCSNFQDIVLTPEYDYVTLIGVLEYASIFFTGKEPFRQCLKIAKSALRNNGKLILAIENRLGLKYFLGYSEDHTGIVYDGLQGFYGEKTAHTFGKKEITELLAKNGFVNANFSYPFPDYKLPKVVLFEQAFESAGFNPSSLISSTNVRDYAYPATSLPSDSFIWKQLEKNNLVRDLANSFLIETSLLPLEIDERLVAKHYTIDRRRQYNVITTFVKENLQIKVEKKNIEKSLEMHKSCLEQQLYNNDYYKGDSLDYLLKKAIARADLVEFAELLKSWVNFLQSIAILEKNDSNIFLSTVKPQFIDCIPSNIIVSKGNLRMIDIEWVYNGKCTLYSLIIRYLVDLDLKHVASSIPGKGNPIQKIFKYLQIDFESRYYDEYLMMENQIIQLVYDDCYTKIKADYVNNAVLNQRYSFRVKNKIKTIVKKILQKK